MTGANLMNKNRPKGFTIIEMLVSTAVFVMVVSISMSTFVFALRAQRQSLATQDLLDQTSYAVEYMSRALRMAKKDLTGVCIPAKTNYQLISDASGFVQQIKFLSYQNQCQSFIWENNQLKEDKDGVVNSLTSENVAISWFDAELAGETQVDNIQPRITFSWCALGKENSSIVIKTAVSQRDADIRE
jgi:prepilin-type N-terminal cleavage/methylation domain-containing protein